MKTSKPTFASFAENENLVPSVETGKFHRFTKRERGMQKNIFIQFYRFIALTLRFVKLVG